MEHIDPAPGAAEALRALGAQASIVILTNAPEHSRGPRSRWLVKHGFDYPFVINSGPKGHAVAAITALTSGKAAFIDDLLPNLESVAAEAPAVARFQMVADERLRPLAYQAVDRHPRIDDWAELGPAIAVRRSACGRSRGGSNAEGRPSRGREACCSASAPAAPRVRDARCARPAPAG